MTKKPKVPVPDLDDVIVPEREDRSNSNYNSGDNFNFEEREYKGNPVASKFFTLFDEETALQVSPILRVRHSFSKNQDSWKILHDGKIIHSIPGTSFIKKEKDFLLSVEGVQFLLRQAKKGGKDLTISALKREMRTAVRAKK